MADSKQDSKRTPVNHPEQENPAQSLDTVRDLLFGGASRDFSARLVSLEKHASEQLAETEADLSSLIQSTVTAMRNEFQGRMSDLEQRLDEETAARRQESVSRAAFVDVMRNALDQIEQGTAAGESHAAVNRAKAS
jgi:hypothetical protein